MKKIVLVAVLALLSVAAFQFSDIHSVSAQDRGARRGPPGGGPGGPGGPPTRDLVADFDKNENGRLDKDELSLALEDVRKNPPARRRRGPGGPGGPGGFGGNSGPNKPGRKVTPADVKAFPDAPLYDDSILRTVFIDIDSDTWEKDMGTLKDYGVDIESTVTVDNKTYEQVGLRFRGNSSFFSVGEGQKRSLNLTFDWADKKQDLYGYRTLNLLNSHADASYLRLVLYGRIAGEYIPVPKSNYVHVVINGESWGIYVNEQQFNTDFTRDYFDTKGGRRWKSPPGRAGASFAYKSDNKADYAGYELKTKDTDEAWNALINATKTLKDAKPDEFDSKVDPVLSIDRVLWFLAVDNVLLDMDGYYQRGADYLIYQEPEFERFHILPYDNNETFRAQGGRGPGFGGGPGGPGGPGGRRGGLFGGGPPPGADGGPPQGGRQGGRGGRPDRGQGGPPERGQGGQGRGGRPPQGGPGGPAGEQKPPFDLDIFAGIDQPLAPFINKLFQNPAVKARYVAHVRTIQNQWMDWNTVSPIIDKYRDLIGDEIKQDTRKLTTLKAYNDGIGMSMSQGRGSSPGLKAFFKGREAYLDKVPELKQPIPKFVSVKAVAGEPNSGGVAVEVTATVDSKGAKPDKVFVHYATDKLAKFQQVEMKSNGEKFVATLPPQPVGKKVYYYCEARTADKYLTTAFHPAYAEGNPDSIRLTPSKAKSSPIVINEILASNKTSKKDPQGEFEDWIELKNVSDKSVDLSGMYLTDDKRNLQKWKFPAKSKVEPGGYLLVWADGQVEADGLHADVKLAKSGETLWLIDADKNGNQILDQLKFGAQSDDRSFGRAADGKFKVQTPTPGEDNGS